MTTLSRNDARRRPSRHAKNRPVLQSAAGIPSGADPYLEDCLLQATALCAEITTHDMAAIARAGEISLSWASEIRRTGGKGSFLHKTTTLAYRLASRRSGRAWMMVAHLKTTLKQAIMPVSDADLIERFWDLLDEEGRLEGEENRAQARMARTRDLADLERATLAEAAVQEELAAVIREIRRRRLDPWAQAQHA